ncbi:MAG: 50S ribosomal protein L5 [Planctomycetaceae bacterium]|nr:50S ribosomal protein L5 [Planctomycetaceae bacterium]
MKARLQSLYEETILPNLAKELGRKNPQSLPKLEKIVISMGLGRSMQDHKILEEAVEHLRTLAGQQPVVTKARRSVSNFKLREGVDIGCMVTLRRARMYEFLDRLVSLVLPRVRDFRGLNPKAFDGRGNYSLGLTEQGVFPEINPDKVKHIQGMNIAIVTTATSNDEGRLLLREFGMPFKKD